MGGEDHAAEPGHPQAEPGEQSPDEQGVEDVEREGDDVVAGGGGAEEMPLDPEEGLLDRVVFDEAAGREPDLEQAAEVAQKRLVGDVPVVVPEPGAVEGGEVDPEGDGDDGEDAGPRRDVALGCGG
jgi:hypothetical protein